MEEGQEAVEGVREQEEVDRGLVGLQNDLGQYNCFLNVIIQSLWHIQLFRQHLLSPAREQHRHQGDPCVICALQSIFQALSSLSTASNGMQVPSLALSPPALSPSSSAISSAAASSAAVPSLQSDLSSADLVDVNSTATSAAPGGTVLSSKPSHSVVVTSPPSGGHAGQHHGGNTSGGGSKATASAVTPSALRLALASMFAHSHFFQQVGG